MNKLQHNKEEFTEQLLKWYDEHARILPWRSQPEPYYVWVSEIMLQQTRVEAVKPYFDRFIKELPDIKSLSEASDVQLSKLWEGLGYYHRVRNMKKCAIQCMELYHGDLPNTYDQLLTLPGIGSYTAGAIASIAYRRCVPAVDGNVLRVFSRVLICEDDILKESTKRKIEAMIMDYIPKERPDAFNQALMEIGAMVCVPNGAPRCTICPLAENCMGYQSGVASRLPNKTAKKKRRIEQKTVIVIVCGDRVHLHQREDSGLLAGMFEFDILNESVSKAQIIKEYSKLYDIAQCFTLHKAKHIFTHIEWHMQGYLMEVTSKAEDRGIWADQNEIITTYAIPTAYKKYRDALLQYWKE